MRSAPKARRFERNKFMNTHAAKKIKVLCHRGPGSACEMDIWCYKFNDVMYCANRWTVDLVLCCFKKILQQLQSRPAPSMKSPTCCHYHIQSHHRRPPHNHHHRRHHPPDRISCAFPWAFPRPRDSSPWKPQQKVSQALTETQTYNRES